MKKRSEQNNFLNSKAFYIIFSIVVSIVLWMYVAYAENPDITVPVSGIVIETVGDEVLAENNLIVTNISNSTLTIRFRGARNAVSKLDNTSVTATVDLSQIAAASSKTSGVYQLPYTINYPSGVNVSSIEVTDATVDYITVTVEKLVTKEIPVKGTYEGEVSEGYQAEPLEFDPNVVTVSGPESIVSQIASAWVVVERDNLSETIEESVPFTFVDVNGAQVDADALEVDTDSVTVTLPIVMVKETALTVNFIDSNSVSSRDVICTISPASVTLSGDAATLRDVNQIVLGTIDLASFPLTTTETFQIPIPNGIENITGETSATVTVKIDGMDTQKLSATNITVKDIPDGHTADVITQSLDVTIRGKEGTLTDITEANIRIVASLSDLENTTGTFSVEASVYIDGYPQADAVGDYKVTVTISPS